MIDVEAARKLLNMGASIGAGRRADEQLDGAVALHNILESRGIAYLADEVGMGKTYVALGALALFRHFDPEFRVLVIAPRANIQRKWLKEQSNFCANNVLFADLRVKSLSGGPARAMVYCENLHSFVHETGVDARRDFFLRMTSFSFGLSGQPEEWKKQRDQLRREVPWLSDEVFDLRSREAFKDNYARAICCAIPAFDLVIVDEGHNLKHGFREHVAARNRVLSLAMGRDRDVDVRLFPRYGRRAKRVLFLSATPVEASYHQLWNQLDIFGMAGPYADLKRRDVSDEDKKEMVKQFLIRRVTSMRVHGRELTKNQYRREWRQGGVQHFDQPIEVTDPRKRLTVALVQKKVAELLGSSQFNMSFQIGMLASFESFLQTALRRQEEPSTFDDPEQHRDLQDVVKEGIDVRDINRLSRHYFERFGQQLPHPKMDEVVASLSASWTTGKKALIFVRRVASVKELKQKLDECYDKWLIECLQRRLPAEVRQRFDGAVNRYRKEKLEAEAVRRARVEQPAAEGAEPLAEGHEEDRGGLDTFFAWFFRGEGPVGIVSGANIQRRFIQAGSVYSTFFDRNHVAEVIRAEPGEVFRKLCRLLGQEPAPVRVEIAKRAARYLSGRAKRFPRRDRFIAAQAAALELLVDRAGEASERAQVAYDSIYRHERKPNEAKEAPDVSEWLEEPTFFSELQRPQWADLRKAIWPESVSDGHDPVGRFRDSELRAQLLSATARLGHGLIDLYVLTIGRLKSLDLRTLESEGAEGRREEPLHIVQYLEQLNTQRLTPVGEREWAAFDELREIADNFALIVDVNVPECRSKDFSEVARFFGTLLGQQQPVAGMSGQVNLKAVRQFRMPGYPFVLVTTDLLQEGEDLHTFCSTIQHYGISWTPSSMEQRIGRIDRVRSQTDRRLSGSEGEVSGDDLLQVHFPYLRDTVEILQVERVLERMNVFLKLMHEGLVTESAEDRHVDVQQVLARGRRPVEAIVGTLKTAFPVDKRLLAGEVRELAVDPSVATDAAQRLAALKSALDVGLHIEWSAAEHTGQLLGTMLLSSGRIQPFTLFVDSLEGRLMVRCVSPVGKLDLDRLLETIAESSQSRRMRVAALPALEHGSYNLTVQDDVLLGEVQYDVARVSTMLTRVAETADLMEKIHLEAIDQQLKVFDQDLRREGVTST